MPKHIPILAAKDIAKAHDCRQVIVVAWDGKLTHVVTYGVSTEECAQAAEGGTRVKRALGWPETLCAAEPSRVRKIREESAALVESISLSAATVQGKPCDRIAALEAELASKS